MNSSKFPIPLDSKVGVTHVLWLCVDMEISETRADNGTSWADMTLTVQRIHSSNPAADRMDKEQLEDPRVCDVGSCKVFKAMKGILTVAQVCGLFPLGGLIRLQLCRCNPGDGEKVSKAGASSVWTSSEKDYHEISFKWISLPTVYTVVVLCIFGLISCLVCGELVTTLDGSALTSSSRQ